MNKNPRKNPPASSLSPAEIEAQQEEDLDRLEDQHSKMMDDDWSSCEDDEY